MTILLFLFSILGSILGYEIAPITDDMTQVSKEVIASLLPTTGVTQTSSIGWQRLAYICGNSAQNRIISSLL
jgi:hypothetical protein